VTRPAPWWQRVLLTVLWTGSVAAIIFVLHRLGSGSLSTPPFTDSTRLQAWTDERDAVTVAFALLRLVALALAWYLLVVTVLGLLARATRIPGLVALTDLGTVPAVRRVLGGIAGIGLTASAATLLVGPSLADHHDRGPVAVSSDESAASGTVVLERLPDGSSLVLERLPDGSGTATMRVVDGGEAPRGPVTWTVVSGDHFWHIAEATLTAEWGRAPSDAEVVPYWRAVVDANRPKLVDPGNPDLIYPGQVFDLPPAPAAPPAPPAPAPQG